MLHQTVRGLFKRGQRHGRIYTVLDDLAHAEQVDRCVRTVKKPAARDFAHAKQWDRSRSTPPSDRVGDRTRTQANRGGTLIDFLHAPYASRAWIPEV